MRTIDEVPDAKLTSVDFNCAHEVVLSELMVMGGVPSNEPKLTGAERTARKRRGEASGLSERLGLPPRPRIRPISEGKDPKHDQIEQRYGYS